MERHGDDGASEPLLPNRSHTADQSNSNAQYNQSFSTMGDGNGAQSPEHLRSSYIKKLGYTPLIFRKVKRIGSSILASLSPGRRKETEDEDSFPYHSAGFMPSKGSVTGSVFNLAGATLGAGALSLPYAVAVSGLGFALLQLVVAALLTVYTIRLLIHAGDLTRLKSYEDLALYCFGNKTAVFVELNILIFCFGIAVAYLVALGDIVTPLGELYFGVGSLLAHRAVLMSISCILIMLPLSLLRDISSLQFSSLLGVCSIIFLVFAVCVRSAMIASDKGLAPDIKWTINLAHGPDFMLSVPIVMFAFTCQVNVFSIYTELQRPCIRRMNKVVDRATFVSFFVYLVIGVAAYLAFGSALTAPELKGNILLSFSLHDALIAVSRAALAFTISVAFPLNIFPCRFTIDMLFFADARESTPRHVTVTTCLVAAALGLAIFCPGVNVVFGVIGGTCSAVVCFCLPAAFILKLEDGPLLGKKKLAPLLLLIGASILGAVGTGVTLWSMFRAED